MTTTVGTHGLTCLSDEDYAAIALYMQAQSNTIDSVLDAISDSFDTTALRPGFTGATNIVNGPVASGSETIFGLNGWVLSYSNFTPAPTSTVGFQFTVPKTGFYDHGCYINAQASGAVTVNSRRTLYSRAFRVTGTGNVLLSQAIWRTVDTNTGGEFLVACGSSFYATAGTTIVILPGWSHANAASNVQVNAGAKIWCWFTGSGVEVGSA